MKKLISILFISLCCFVFCYDAAAFWIWTPKTKKLINPKRAIKDTPEEQFKWAMKLFEEKDYKWAAEEFISLVENYKDSDLAPEAQYYAGRAYEESGKYYFAFQNYQKVIESYPFTEKIDEIIKREYELGEALYKRHRGKLMGKELMTDLDRAVEIFQRVRENAPFGEYADKAQFMIGECYKKSEQYNEAIDAFQKVVDEYPQRESVDKAKYEVALCTYLASLKSDYDQELTEEAIKRFKKFTKNQEDPAGPEAAEAAIFLLEDKKAESLFKTAKFYERQKQYKSAVIYYQEIIDKYPKSVFSKSASERLKEIDPLLKKAK
ncbi:MAG: hypothetical protein A2Z72_04075 [Omnitrophica bacterium RBG_13_46_9]|nr:MAG: hypothetical protein A2Z72_04075 [Omnitrophica bacterium RBG_13_46_9]